MLLVFYQQGISSAQSLNHVWFFATPCTAAHQASLSVTNSQSLLKLMSIEMVMSSNHLIFCHPLLLPPSIFPSIRVFSNESVLCIRWPKYWSFSFSISPSNDWREDSKYGHHQMANTEIRLIIFFAAKDGEALYSQQKQDQELTVAQIINSLLPNSDLNWRK